MAKNSMTFACAALTLCGIAAADTGIEDLAPKNSVLIAGVKNAQESLDHLKATRLWDLWNAAELRDTREGIMEEFQNAMEQMFAELDVDQDELPMPAGPLGIALFPVIDMELNEMQLGMLSLTDYGDNADAQADLMAAMLKQGEDEGSVEVEEREILGHTVTSITTIEDEEPMPGDDDMDMGLGGMGLPGADMLSGLADGFKTMHSVRIGSQFLFGSDLPTLTAAIEALEDGPDESIADNETFQRVRDRLNTEADGYAVLLTGNAGQLVSGLMAAQQQGGMNPLAMIAPQLKGVVGDIHGLGMDFRIGGDAGMVEQNVTVYMPAGKRGLTELINVAGPRGDLPTFAGANATSFSSFSVQMNRFGDVFNNIANSTMLGMLIAQQREEIDAMVNDVVATVGNELYVISSMRRPIAPETVGNVMALRLKDEQGFENLISDGLAGAAEPRDFLGRRIYDMDAAAMGLPGGAGGTVSLGIGGGFLVTGQTTGVEDAIRSLGDTGNAGLATRESYQRALGALSGRPVVGWGYSDTVDTLEVQMVMQKQAQMEQIEMIREFDPDFAREMEQEMNAQTSIMEQLDFDLLRRYIGPSAWELLVDEEGFRFRSVTLDASDN